jgi:purine-binding chemotaxis protein CheW
VNGTPLASDILIDIEHDEMARTLRARADALAQPAVNAQPPAGGLAVLEFGLAQERYGIAAHAVREVFPLRMLTPVPCCPRFVLGIVNVRGQILPVVDIKKLFDLPDQALSELNKVIIVHDEEMELGILADVVIGMRLVPLDSIQTSLPTLAGIRERYLKGITRDRLVVLNIEKILLDPKIVVNEEVPT